MKKFLITICLVLFCLFFTLGLAACNNENADNNSSSENPPIGQGFSLTTNIDNCTISETKIELVVSNETDSFSFINAFNIPESYKWELHWDKACLPNLNIVSKSVDLENGDNIMYALFANKNNADEIYLYEIIVHRKYNVIIQYYYNSKVQYQETVSTYEKYIPNYSLHLNSRRYQFNYWEDENGEKVSETGVYVYKPLKFYANVTTFETETITVLENELSNYVKIKNVTVAYENHGGHCSAHPYVEFDVIFTPPSNSLTVSNVDIKVNVGGIWAVDNYSSNFYSGYDDEGNYKTASNNSWHLRFNYNIINLEETTTNAYTKHFKADTSGNACNKQLTYWDVKITLRGSFQYEILKK